MRRLPVSRRSPSRSLSPCPPRRAADTTTTVSGTYAGGVDHLPRMPPAGQHRVLRAGHRLLRRDRPGLRALDGRLPEPPVLHPAGGRRVRARPRRRLVLRGLDRPGQPDDAGSSRHHARRDEEHRLPRQRRARRSARRSPSTSRALSAALGVGHPDENASGYGVLDGTQVYDQGVPSTDTGTFTITWTIPDEDGDDDGVPDGEDNCPIDLQRRPAGHRRRRDRRRCRPVPRLDRGLQGHARRADRTVRRR